MTDEHAVVVVTDQEDGERFVYGPFDSSLLAATWATTLGRDTIGSDSWDVLILNRP